MARGRPGAVPGGRRVQGRLGQPPRHRRRRYGETRVPPGLTHAAARRHPAPAGPRPGPAPLAVSVVNAVVRVRGGGAGGRAILAGVSFHLEGGAFLGVLGASGSGKSTLVRALAGLTDLAEGAVRLDGRRASG